MQFFKALRTAFLLVFVGFSFYQLFVCLVVTPYLYKKFSYGTPITDRLNHFQGQEAQGKFRAYILYIVSFVLYRFRIPYSNVTEINYLKDLEEKK